MKLNERTKLKLSGIYLIKNTITGHCYIGQAKNICKRIYYHLLSVIDETKSDYNYPVHKAIRKYGLDAFELELVEACDCSRLNTREQYWVTKYDSRKNGYNQTDGGYQSIRHVKLTKEQVLELKKLLAENKLSNTELANMFKVSADTVQRINNGKMWYENTIHYPIRVVSKDRANHYNGSCIKQIDKNTGLVIKIFPSISAAAKALGLKPGTTGAISDCLYRPNGTAYGYKWQKEVISKEDWFKLFN